ncbi:aspartate 1-decarboxylase [Lyngbya confervoides]|uniref:Aspartate 1-decarboxylase n=1 Tax=Lyngbya confervoides BDU141951 TaxID=1574623 RepID=A0ABD4T237_9CYAN|nr:aspartate 1-decarboxylase [Lyngbya confervoides]MCM1982500.1 aspartate 1-decarboxylase [Lyngbya confervoides BDU141951]
MQRTFLCSKLHGCTLTGTHLHYVGSISIDKALLQAAQIGPYEQVQVVNVNNGERLMTYVIEAPPHSGVVELNGAAARLGAPGDRIIIMTYALLDPVEAEQHEPTVVVVGDRNQVLEVRRDLIFHYA